MTTLVVHEVLEKGLESWMSNLLYTMAYYNIFKIKNAI